MVSLISRACFPIRTALVSLSKDLVRPMISQIGSYTQYAYWVKFMKTEPHRPSPTSEPTKNGGPIIADENHHFIYT